MAKLHFLFTMLSITQVFVVNLGEMVGIITKTSFIKHKTAPIKPIHINKNFIDEPTAANTLERKMIEAIKEKLKQMEEPRTPQQNQFEPLKNALKVPIHEIEPSYHTGDI